MCKHVCMCPSVFGYLSKRTFKQFSLNFSSSNWCVPFYPTGKLPLPLCNQVHFPSLRKKPQLALLSNTRRVRKGLAHIRYCPAPILVVIPSAYRLHGSVMVSDSPGHPRCSCWTPRMSSLAQIQTLHRCGGKTRKKKSVIQFFQRFCKRKCGLTKLPNSPTDKLTRKCGLSLNERAEEEFSKMGHMCFFLSWGKTCSTLGFAAHKLSSYFSLMI